MKTYRFILPDGKEQVIQSAKTSVKNIVKAFANNPQLDVDEFGRYVVNNIHSFKAILNQVFKLSN